MTEWSVWIAFGGLLFTMVSALVAFAFQMGKLSQRMLSAESAIVEIKEQREGDGADHDLLIELRTQGKAMCEDIAALKRGMDGVQRQLANVAGMKGGHAMELPSNI